MQTTPGYRVAARRKELGWSQRKLAEAVGAQQPNIDQLEKGSFSKYFIPVCMALGLSPLWAWDETGPRLFSDLMKAAAPEIDPAKLAGALDQLDSYMPHLKLRGFELTNTQRAKILAMFYAQREQPLDIGVIADLAVVLSERI